MPRAWELAIEVSNPSSRGDAGADGASVAAAWVDEAEIVVERLRVTERQDDDLMPAIERVRSLVGASPLGLSRVSVSAGPGGYTGLRVAVVAAKLMAEVSGASVVLVPTASVAAAGLSPSAFPAVVCLASKRGTAHGTLFECGDGAGEELGLLDGPRLQRVKARTLVADAFLAPELAAAGAAAGMARAWPGLEARRVMELARSERGAGWVVDAARATPLYPREPEAVRKWRELHPPASGG